MMMYTTLAQLRTLKLDGMAAGLEDQMAQPSMGALSFRMRPDQAENHVDWMLAKRAFSVDHENLYEVYDNPNNRDGINVRAMRKIKKVYRPFPGYMQQLAQSAGYDAGLISPYLHYLGEFHAHGHPDQVWL